MKFICCILFISICTIYSAKSQNIVLSADSLNQLAQELQETNAKTSLVLSKMALKIAESKSDSFSMAQCLVNIGLAHYYLSQFDSAVISLKKSYRFYKSRNSAAGISIAANNLGMVYYQLGNIGMAEKYYQISLDNYYTENDTAGMALGLNNLAMIYEIRGDYNKAVRFYFLSAEFERKSGNAMGECQSWMSIGNVYSESGNIAKGNEFYQKSLTYFTMVNDSQNLSLVLSNIGDNFRLSGNYSEAKKYLSRASALAAECNYDIGLINAQIYYSKLLNDENKPDSAEYYLFEALNRCVETDNNLLACEALMQQGLVLSGKKQYSEANQYLLNAYEFAVQMQYASAIESILQQLSDNYSALGNFKEALKYQKMAANAISGVKQPEEISANRKPETASTKESVTDNLIKGVSGGLFLIVLMSAVFFYTRMKHYKKIAESHTSSGEERH
ncbi:hypothetical protein SDC9_53640 [bioreactor metagenome]|uniref:Photosystem I assembly protein Ycf3 n=1 Tax=bioreactor metagenome TaxID=1076179 RepID=A0A644WZH0_9ZZZZ